jgi:hypothetical protein
MSEFTKTSGNFKPVVNVDVAQNSSEATLNQATSGVTVQPQGPKLEFFTIELATVATDGAVLKATIDTIQQLATIYMYEVTDTGTDKIAIAVYPVGAWTASTLDTATGGTTTASATFTN